MNFQRQNSTFNRHLGCHQVLAIMNISAINIHVQVCMWTQIFNSLDILQNAWLTDWLHGNSVFNDMVWMYPSKIYVLETPNLHVSSFWRRDL
jgi:hypothetical protein